MPTNRKTHLVVAQEDVAVEDTVTSCGELTKRRSITTHPEDVTCEDCGVTAEADQPSDGPEATTQPPVLTGKLEGDDLIARKRLAGAGRTQEAGTAFGSRWTDAERDELQTLFDEHGPRQGRYDVRRGPPAPHGRGRAVPDRHAAHEGGVAVTLADAIPCSSTSWRTRCIGRTTYAGDGRGWHHEPVTWRSLIEGLEDRASVSARGSRIRPVQSPQAADYDEL